MIRPLLHCILFAVGMGATVCVIRGLDEVPFWSWTRPKIVHLAAHAGEFDTVFVGSSRTHGGVVPQLFDRRMAELGTPTRSFNLGVAGLRPDDFGPIIDWVATGNAGPIRRAVVEVHAFDPSLREGNWMSDVEVEMHTPGWLGSRLGSVACTQASLFEKATMVGSAFAHASVNTLRVGQGARILDDLFAGTSKLAGGGTPHRFASGEK